MDEPVGETLVIRQSRLKQLLLMLGGLSFVAIGTWMVSNPDASTRRSAEWVLVWGWICIAFFGAAALLAFVRLVRPSTIRLSPEGFTVEHWPTGRLIRWSSVESFSIWKQRATRLAAWRLHEGAAEHSWMTGINASFGIHGTASAGWEESPEAIVGILRAWKNRYAPEPGEALESEEDAPRPRW